MRLERALAALGWLSVALGGAALIVGRFGERCDACDAVNIGRPYWLALEVAGLSMLTISRTRLRGRWRPIAMAAAFVFASTLRGAMPAAISCAPGVRFGSLRVVAFNAWMNNADPELAARRLVRMRPDVIALVEAKGGSAPIPALLAAHYPYRISCNARARCSTQILSRLRPVMTQPWGQGDAENRKTLSAAAMSVVSPGGRAVTIVAVHLSQPLPLGQQRRELRALDARLAGIDPALLIIAGDFNATRDSITLGDFVRRHRLAAVSTGPTWPTSAAVSFVPSLLAIDHIFVGRDVSVHHADCGPVLGSDHRPVFASLCLKGAGQ